MKNILLTISIVFITATTLQAAGKDEETFLTPPRPSYGTTRPSSSSVGSRCSSMLEAVSPSRRPSSQEAESPVFERLATALRGISMSSLAKKGKISSEDVTNTFSPSPRQSSCKSSSSSHKGDRQIFQCTMGSGAKRQLFPNSQLEILDDCDEAKTNQSSCSQGTNLTDEEFMHFVNLDYSKEARDIYLHDLAQGHYIIMCAELDYSNRTLASDQDNAYFKSILSDVIKGYIFDIGRRYEYVILQQGDKETIYQSTLKTFDRSLTEVCEDYGITYSPEFEAQFNQRPKTDRDNVLYNISGLEIDKSGHTVDWVVLIDTLLRLGAPQRFDLVIDFNGNSNWMIKLRQMEDESDINDHYRDLPDAFRNFYLNRRYKYRPFDETIKQICLGYGLHFTDEQMLEVERVLEDIHLEEKYKILRSASMFSFLNIENSNNANWSSIVEALRKVTDTKKQRELVKKFNQQISLTMKKVDSQTFIKNVHVTIREIFEQPQ